MGDKKRTILASTDPSRVTKPSLSKRIRSTIGALSVKASGKGLGAKGSVPGTGGKVNWKVGLLKGAGLPGKTTYGTERRGNKRRPTAKFEVKF